MRRYIIEGLSDYLKKENIPWHMPGHKRKGMAEAIPCCDILQILSQIEKMDITEVPGSDDLHCPRGMIAESMEELKKVYHTYGSYYLINGATCGLMASIAAACCDGFGQNNTEFDILIAENSHTSVHHAVELLGLSPCYIKVQKAPGIPDIFGGILPEEIERLCRMNPGLKAAVITSPTYEGVISDVEEIARILKKYGVLFIVDEAHGAHLPFIEKLPESAISLGADLVVQSLHKTLPSLTQTAILHNQNPSLKGKIEKYLSVFMSSSPSYVFLCSMENAVAWASEKDYKSYLKCLTDFRKKASELKHLRLLSKEDAKKIGAFDYDESRLVFWAQEGITGSNLERLFREKGNIVCEMSGADYVVLISTAKDEEEDFRHLYRTLLLIEDTLRKTVGENTNSKNADGQSGSAREADLQEQLQKIFSLEETAAQQDIYVYPPGIPIVRRGETISREKLSYLEKLINAGKELRGI